MLHLERFLGFIGLLAALVAVGCYSAVDTASPLPETRVVVDRLGRSVTVPATIRRVVSLAPDLTETMFAIGAGDRLVGVTTFCTFPDEAKSIAKIGDTINPNLESIIALKPDLVLVSTASQIEAFSKTLQDRNIGVYILTADSLDAVLTNMSELGALLGVADRSVAVVGALRERISALEAKAASQRRPARRVFVQISREPLFTVGSSSFITSALRIVGAESVTAEIPTAYPKLSKETAATLDPEFMILSESDDNLEPNPVFASSRAVSEKRVVRVNADLLSRPGPRLVEALEIISREFETQ